MRQTISIAPANSILVVSGPKGVEIPGPSDALIWSTPTCVIVGCYTFCDGETEVTFGSAGEVDPGALPAFDATLNTPDREVIVWTVEDETIFNADVSDVETRVRIWVNDPKEPDVVIIGLG
jgi:hypothetical protein